ncbi:hypothetical protein B566_EDAN015153 [Ephemera danica]|nr:hypothetical protein B566_EDAN015153 [Ephemera danica]
MIVPVLSLEKSKGLSTQQVKKLSEELDELAEELKGEVMIFELAQHVQKYLLAFNKPGFQSFYDEMQARQALQEQQKQLMRQQEQDRERQALQEHIKQKQQALKEEQRRRREHRSPSQHGNAQTSHVQRSNSLSHIQNSTGSRRRYKINIIASHGARGSVAFAVQDIESGELCIATQWLIKCPMPRRKGSLDASLNPELAAALKQAWLEQELSLLQKLSHQGLIHYLGLTTEHARDGLALHLLQDFAMGISLSMFLEERIAIGLELLQHIAKGVLDPLCFLHRNNVVHKDLRHSCVYLHQNGHVLLSDFSLDKRLGDIVQGANRVSCGLPPELGRGGKKADMHRFGSLLLSLLKGEPISDLVQVVPSNLPNELKDFLERCLDKDEHTRWSAQQLLNHPFVKTSVERGDRLSPQRPNALDQRRDRRESVTSAEDGDNDSHLLLPPGVRSGPSRVLTEFEVLQWLGKGAFGDVLKYALKRIKLNPRNKALNRKITREVKLLSRLNHENVVRYYNSWIESAVITSMEVDGSETPSSQQTPSTPIVPPHAVGEEALQDASVAWSVSCEARPQNEAADLSDDADSSSDDEEAWLAFFPEPESSSSIVFEGGSVAEDSVDSPSEHPVPDSGQERVVEPKELQFMYIQMEFCEKSTLRNAIDSGTLFEDEPRVWRLFREMVEGLAHIHQQGMIHRDLKPVNVFLDLHDHVKIGDFGLATSSTLPPAAGNKEELMSLEALGSQDLGDGILTGQVGTALYTAPELSSTGGKAVYYNQKVDIYSLGIIFFEMCHAPLATTMERVKVLAALRSPQLTLPTDFTEQEHTQQVQLLRWLLNHDPMQRPSAQELLRAECMLQLQHEGTQLQEALRAAFAAPQSKAYKHLVSACFEQTCTPAEDMTYDLGLGKSGAPSWAVRAARTVVERVFERHGAIRLNTPLLMPCSSAAPPTRESTAMVAVMTHSGSVVTLPHDLRVPFARYVAWNGITSLKRFAVERVFRERRVFGLHPKEMYECGSLSESEMLAVAWEALTEVRAGATGQCVVRLNHSSLVRGVLLHCGLEEDRHADVTTILGEARVSGSLSESEMLAVAWEALTEVRAGATGQCVVRLNHSSLVRGVLLHCGLEEDRHADVTTILGEARDSALSRTQVQTRLLSLCLPRHTLDSLAPLLQTELPLAQASPLKALARGRGPAAALAKEGLRHLEAVAHAAEALGVKCPILVAPGMVLDPARYSGLLCQFACEGRTKHAGRSARDVIAVGGTYSHLLDQFR